jgi:hypothetical protein
MNIFFSGEGNGSRIYIAKNKRENEFRELLLIELNKIKGYERVQRYEE